MSRPVVCLGRDALALEGSILSLGGRRGTYRNAKAGPEGRPGDDAIRFPVVCLGITARHDSRPTKGNLPVASFVVVWGWAGENYPTEPRSVTLMTAREFGESLRFFRREIDSSPVSVLETPDALARVYLRDALCEGGFHDGPRERNLLKDFIRESYPTFTGVFPGAFGLSIVRAPILSTHLRGVELPIDLTREEVSLLLPDLSTQRRRMLDL